MSFYVTRKVGVMDMDRAKSVSEIVGATFEAETGVKRDTFYLHFPGWRGPVKFHNGSYSFDTDVLPRGTGFTDALETKTHPDINRFMQRYTVQTAVDWAREQGHHDIVESQKEDGSIVLRIDIPEELTLEGSSFSY